ncbi:unnamed protein product [Arabidopsis halleri]
MNYGNYRRHNQSRSTQDHEEPSRSNSRTPSLSPESPTSETPMEMSIEDFVSQPGRERLTKLHPDRIDHATWFESSGNGISKSVLKMMQGLLKDPYPTYSSMPAKEQDLWFKQFAQEFNWDRNLTLEVRKAFDIDTSSRYRGTINEWKQRWVKDKKPRGVNDKVFEGLQLHWVKPETQAKSKTNSKNRKSDQGGKGIATHNSGATSHYTRGEQIAERDGVYPDHLTVMEDTHTNKKNKQLQDPVAKEVVENSKKRKQEYLLTQPSIDGVENSDVPMEIVNKIVFEETPKRKGRIFGLGKLGVA